MMKDNLFALKNRSDEAFEQNQLFSAMMKKMKRYISTRVNNVDDVDDIIQMTFVIAIQNIDKYSEKSSLETWIFGISKNLIKEYYRRNKKSVQSVDIEISVLISECRFDVIIDNHRLIESVIEKINAMPDDEREILLSIFYDDQEYDFIAKKMNIPIGTLKSKVFRAREQLKKLYVIHSCKYQAE